MPRHQPTLPTVTTSGPAVTQHQFSHVLSRQRTSAEKPGQIGKTVTVKAVCRSDIQGQKGGAGKKFTHVFIFFFFSLSVDVFLIFKVNTRPARWPSDQRGSGRLLCGLQRGSEEISEKNLNTPIITNIYVSKYSCPMLLYFRFGRYPRAC